jgi:Kef-type K+ transport system membrane component KefB
MVRTLKIIFFIGIGLSILIGLFVPNEHAHFWWERIPAFDAIFGFLGCIIIVVGSKALGHYWLQRNEDYYDD